MIHEIDLSEAVKVQDMFTPLDYNLAIASMIAGSTPGRIFADQQPLPSAAAMVFHHHLFLAGAPDRQDFNQALSQLLEESLIPEAQAAGRDALMVHPASQEWDAAIAAILAASFPIRRPRLYLERRRSQPQARRAGERAIPEGFSIVPVSRELLEQPDLAGREYLMEELASERESPGDFLEKSFGYCVVNERGESGPELASWCLSEYNTGPRCEVGVATVEAYQRRGLATAATRALVEHAHAHGINRVGWHCWAGNLPSLALAKKAGFELIKRYEVGLCVFNLAVQFALHGRDRREAGDTAGAVEWYERAASQEGAPAWVHYAFACTQASLGKLEAAFSQLRTAVELGFDDFEQANAEPDLEPLRRDPQWKELLKSSG